MLSEFLNHTSDPEMSTSTQIPTWGDCDRAMLRPYLGGRKPGYVGMDPGHWHLPKHLLRFGYHSWVSGVSDGSLSLQDSYLQT